VNQYPKRLIEVDLPIKRISAHARREKSIRHGHISTLHIWWARRPLAACRAVICAALWPDPADEQCPGVFRTAAVRIILDFARKVTTDTKLANEHCSPENFKLWQELTSPSASSLQPLDLRQALLDFIADFANWDNSTVREYLDTSRALTQAAHEALGGAPGTRPLVVDPFCGGGSIPLEVLRVGADAFASDLNPIPVLLNKVVLEYIPKYGQRLADEVRKWGEWIKREAEKELAEFYPKDPDGATPIAYLWSRTIQCEGPGCGAEVPLIRSLWLAKKANRSVALQLVPRPGADARDQRSEVRDQGPGVDFQIIVKQRGGWVDQDDPKTIIEDPKFDGTVKRGSATCPCCGYTTPVARVREQFKKRSGGANDARLLSVVLTRPDLQGRSYRLPRDSDIKAVQDAAAELTRRIRTHKGALSLVPEETTEHYHSFVNRGPIYGMSKWVDYFTHRQALALTTLVKLTVEVGRKLVSDDPELPKAVQTVLALAVDRQVDATTSLCRWHVTGEKHTGTFGRQALPMVWDFSEVQPFSDSTGGFAGALTWVTKVLSSGVGAFRSNSGQVSRACATEHPLPNDSANVLFTDPPYYFSVQYADLSDFFFVWLRRSLGNCHHDLLSFDETPKEREIIVQSPGHEFAATGKNNAFYERMMSIALAEGRRVLAPDGIGVVVFAHTATAGWEAMLGAMIEAGWIITGSWPIDTEMAARVIAQGRSVLASSVHLVCRPREHPDGSVRTDEVGDWRDVLAELPPRIHDWMPRLAEEGVVGADAIFACLGPALEVFSRYSRVEKASGEPVPLNEYLEQVWAAVAKEALTMIFTGADATGFEEDARLTAMWLWTLKTDESGQDLQDEQDVDADASGENPVNPVNPVKKGGFVLEFDAARKIAQGLGAHLEDLASLVAVEGETARLLPVAERARALFGKDEGKAAPTRRKREPQMDLFKALQADDNTQASFGETKVEAVGKTVLDRVHQSMILFAASRSEALKRFLVEDGAGNDQRFWRLAQALSALYPSTTDEKRWVDGVLARKKGLGF